MQRVDAAQILAQLEWAANVREKQDHMAHG